MECSKKHLRSQSKPYSIFKKKPLVTIHTVPNTVTS